MHDHSLSNRMSEIRLHEGRQGNAPGYRAWVKREARRVARRYAKASLRRCCW